MDCIGTVGRVFGHNFKPVYDEKSEFKGDPAMVESVTSRAEELSSLCVAGNPVEDIVALMNTDTTMYVQHVCERCGAVVRRAQ